MSKKTKNVKIIKKPLLGPIIPILPLPLKKSAECKFTQKLLIWGILGCFDQKHEKMKILVVLVNFHEKCPKSQKSSNFRKFHQKWGKPRFWWIYPSIRQILLILGHLQFAGPLDGFTNRRALVHRLVGQIVITVFRLHFHVVMLICTYCIIKGQNQRNRIPNTPYRGKGVRFDWLSSLIQKSPKTTIRHESEVLRRSCHINLPLAINLSRAYKQSWIATRLNWFIVHSRWRLAHITGHLDLLGKRL